MAVQSYQLNVRFPQLDTPLRLSPPSHMNTPERTDEQTEEQRIRASAFAPASFARRRAALALAAAGSDTQTMPDGRAPVSRRTHSENQAPSVTAISDYTVLASSSQRAGRPQMEGLAYFCIGVLYDNMGQYGKALEAYKKYLGVCRRTDDKQGEALAHNCMGVDCHYLACPPGANAAALVLMAAARAALARAAEHHSAHLALADDGGACVARTNLGLAAALAGAADAAAEHHQAALRAAARARAPAAQSVAIGNLGLLALRRGDAAAAQACLERRAELARAAGDAAAEAAALRWLGGLAGGAGDHARALECLTAAAALSKEAGALSTLKRLHCCVGLERGAAGMDEMFARLVPPGAHR
ncbi:hypothetical protein JKP88DRAFT_258737 [Tribonema minus]|uniref:Uncharacterized protein n=1 Tax=Tribonema minus TaxID=303371 RepID=A0A836C9X6_9STRA|nr:hypothetical protein JKP88DRAFT_258737 [Tribonema minus]